MNEEHQGTSGAGFTSLAQVRDSIDDLDRRLIALLARRSEAVMAAIPFKEGQTLAEAGVRRDAVVAQAVELARRTPSPFGPDFEALVSELFVTLTNRSMELQVRVGGLQYADE